MLAFARDPDDGRVGLMEIYISDVANDLIDVYKESIGVKGCRLVGGWWCLNYEDDYGRTQFTHKRSATDDEQMDIAALVRVIKITETLEESE